MLAALGLPLPGDPLYGEGRRDASQFYLEHALLRYTAFASREPFTIFDRDDPERGPIAPSLTTRLAELAA